MERRVRGRDHPAAHQPAHGAAWSELRGARVVTFEIMNVTSAVSLDVKVVATTGHPRRDTLARVAARFPRGDGDARHVPSSREGAQAPLRAKWDHCFESLLDGTLDVSRQPRRWWDDFLLLGVNARLLADTILATPRTASSRSAASSAPCARRVSPTSTTRTSSASATRSRSSSSSIDRRLGSRGREARASASSASAPADKPPRTRTSTGSSTGAPTSPRITRFPSRCAASPCDSSSSCAPPRRTSTRTPSSDGSWSATPYEPIMKILIAPVDVPGGGSESATSGVATALARGPESFGKDEPRAETTTLDAFLSLGKAATEKDDANGTSADVRRTGRPPPGPPPPPPPPPRLSRRRKTLCLVLGARARRSGRRQSANDFARRRRISSRAFAELARIVQRVRASTRSRGRRGDLRAPRRRLRARVHARGE